QVRAPFAGYTLRNPVRNFAPYTSVFERRPRRQTGPAALRRPCCLRSHASLNSNKGGRCRQSVAVPIGSLAQIAENFVPDTVNLSSRLRVVVCGWPSDWRFGFAAQAMGGHWANRLMLAKAAS